MSSTPSLTSSMTFDHASRAVVTYLHTHLPMGAWQVTRLENGRQMSLHLDEDNVYGLTRGASGPWEGSYCRRMMDGEAPRVAPDAARVPAYAAAPVNRERTIAAYAGVPIREASGDVFGVLCGIDPHVKGSELAAAQPLLELLSSLLEMVLLGDRERDEAARRVQEAELAAQTDSLTGLYNRRAWDELLTAEEERFTRSGDPIVVMVLDLDLLKRVNDVSGHAAGDRYIQAAAAALRSAVRSTDPVARLGGDEFGILMRGCEESEAETRVAGLYAALEARGVAGSVGWAPLRILTGFPAALEAADAAMYRAKRQRRAVRAAVDVVA